MVNESNLKKQARKDLSQYEGNAKNYIRALEELQAGLWFWDIKNNVTNVNERWAQNLGYTKAEVMELCPETCKDLVHPDDQEKFRENINSCKDKKQNHFKVTLRMLCKDKTYRFTENMVQVLEKDESGNPSVLFATQIDVSEYYIREEETAIKKTSDIIEIAPFPIVISDIQTNTLVYANKRAKDAYALGDNQGIGSPSVDFYVHHEDRQKFISILTSTGSVYDFEVQLYDYNRNTYWALMSATIIEFHGKPSIIVSINDINKRKNTELELEEEKRNYQLLTESISDVIWIYDLEKEKLEYMSPSITAITGFSPDETMNLPTASLITDEVKLGFIKNLQQAAKKFLRNGRKAVEITQEVKLLKKDGTDVWTEHVCKIVDDRNGEMRVIGVTRNIEERKRTENYIEYLNTHDQLTGLLNKTAFRLFELEYSSDDNDYAIFFIDLDNFGVVNDAIGHREGDSIIVNIASKITKSMADRGRVFRYEGDEFVIFIPSSNQDYLQAISSDLVKYITTEARVNDNAYILTASIGIAMGEENLTMDRVLNNAASALHIAKHVRNSVRFYSPNMDDLQRREVILEKDLPNALLRNQLRVFYQPIYDVRKGGVFQFEALLRWKHPELGLVGPAEFISIAEKNNYIIPITEWVYKEVLNTIKRFEDAGHDNISVSVNFSILAFTNRVDNLINFVNYAHEESGVLPSKIYVEITESMGVQNSKDLIRAIQLLKDLGIRFELDDFGTGYSTFGKIKELPLNVAKIDRSLVMNVETDKKAFMIVDTMISVLHSLELEVVIEGVETLKQFETLVALNPDHIQGFLFSQPIPSKEVLKYLEKTFEYDGLPVFYRFNENNVAIHWRDEWNCGIQEIDDEHRQLYRAVNYIDLYKDDLYKVNELNQDFYQKLIDRISQHFDREEEILKEHKFPLLDNHADIHQELLDKVIELFEAQKNDPNKKDEFLHFLTESYIVDHILHDDSQFIRFLNDPETPMTNLVFVDDYKNSAESNDAGHYRRKLKESINLQNLLSEISHSLMMVTPQNFNDKVNDALKRCAKFVNADRAYIFTYDFDKNTTSNTHEYCQENINPEIDNLQDVPLEMVPDWVHAHSQGKTINIYDVKALPKNSGLREILEPQGIWSILTTPMMVNNIPFGFMGFDSVMKHHLYTDYERAILSEISNVILVAFQRTKDQIKLDSEKELYSNTLASLNEGIIVINDDHIVEFCNKAAKEIFGIHIQSLKGININEGFKIYDFTNHKQSFIDWDYLNKYKVFNIPNNTYIKLPNGEIRFIEGSININDGHGFLINFRDISYKKENERLAEAFFTMNSDLFFVGNFDGYFERVNNRFLDVLGFRSEDLNGSKILDTVHPDDIEKTGNEIANLANGKIVNNFVVRSIGKDGRVRSIEWSAQKGISNLFYATGRDVTDRIEVDAEKEYLSYHDVMTDLYNRRYIEDIFKRFEADEKSLPLSIISCDVDSLKFINDEYGHLLGDEAILEASQVLKKNCRPTDIIARYGGDEFMIVLPNTKNEYAQKIVDRIHEHKAKISNDIEVTLSAGTSTRCSFEVGMDETIRSADAHMYQNKRAKVK